VVNFDIHLILIAFLLTLLLSEVIKRFGKKLEIETKKLQQHVLKLNKSTEEVFDHIFEIKSYEAENFIWGK